MSGFHGSNIGKWQPGTDEILVIFGIGERLPTSVAVAFQMGEVGREGAIQMAWMDRISIRTPTLSMS